MVALNSLLGEGRRSADRRARLALEPLEPRLLLSGSEAQAALQLFNASPALFVPNVGQWANDSVRFAHDGTVADVAMTDTGPVFQIVGQDAATGAAKALVFSASFVGANAVAPVGMEQAETVFNYYVGDQSRWREGVPSYKVVAYQGLYDGIDLLTWGLRSHLKYEFHVAPGADWSQIQVRYDGIAGLSVADDGSLVADLGDGWGTMTDAAPVVYQDINGERVEVAARFVLVDPMTYSFEITGAYDPSQPLVIDPALTWTTYLGGAQGDAGTAIALDTAGNIFVTGYTASPGWVSVGGDLLLGGTQDAFVVRLTAAGGHTWSTYLGGDALDAGDGIAVDSSGDVYVVGYTESTFWPAGGYDLSYGGLGDGFVAKIAGLTGTHVWSSYLGGGALDKALSVAVDSQLYIYVGGRTASPGWTLGGFDTTHNGQQDGFLVRMDGLDGSHVWSTYLGGTENDAITDVTVEAATGISYMTGYTYSAGWVTGGFDTSFNGVADAFVASLSAAGAHVWSTYLGGTALDRGNGIFLSGTSLYIAGYTESANWAFAGYDMTYNGGGDAFVACLNTVGMRNWITYFGGTASDTATDVVRGGTGVFFTGTTESQGIQLGAFDSTLGGIRDAFVAKLAPAGDNLLWASYLGGANDEGAKGIAMATDIFVVGSTSSPGWVAGGYDTTYGGASDGFVARIADTPVVIVPPTIASLTITPNPAIPPATINLTANGVADADGTVVRVEFYRDANGNAVLDAADTLLGTDTSSAGGWTLSSSSSTWPGGLNTVFARAQDNSGAWSNPVSATVMVGSLPPVITTLIAAPDPVTRPNPFTLTATGVTDPDGTVTQVAFYRDVNGNAVWDAADTPLGIDTDGSDGWSYTGNASGAAGWSLGTHTVFAVATDNTNTISAAAATTLTVNGVNTPPVLTTLTATPDPVTRPAPLTLTATGVADPDGLVSQVEFYMDNGNGLWDGPAAEILLGTDTSGANGWTWTGSTAGWTLGTHTFFARALDNDGDVSAPPAATTVVVQRPVILVGDGQAKSLTYWHPERTKVTVQMRGGVADLNFGGNWTMLVTRKGITLLGEATLDGVTLLGTNAASELIFKTKGKVGLPTLGDITCAGSMGLIDARGMRLIGNVAIGGVLGALRLLTTGHDPITIDATFIGSLNVAQWIEAVRLTSLTGIGQIVAGGIRNSSIFVAVAALNDANADGVLDLPNPATDFAAQFGIGSVLITGKVWDDTNIPVPWAMRAPSFINSNIAAWNIGTVTFSYALTNNGTWPMGFACRSLQQLTYFDDAVTVQQTQPTTTYVNGDLEVRIAP